MKRKMLTLTAVIALSVMTVGCVSIKYADTEGRKLTYKRFGGQAIEGFEITRDFDEGLSVKMDKSSGDMGALADVIVDLAEKAAEAR